MDEITVQSRVDGALLTRTLARGSVAAGLGIVGILVAGVELPPTQLAIWGIPILVVGLGLIAMGLVPYRLLTRRRDNPDELTVSDDGITYKRARKPILTIPLDAASRVSFLNDPPAFGILVKLKDHPPEKVHVHTRDYDVVRVRRRTRRRFDADLFFPFFQENEFDEVRRALALANYTDEL